MAVTPAAVVAETSADLIRGYLEDAIAAEKGFEAELREFAGEGDDEDVQAAFAAHANQTRHQQERLAERLQQLGPRISTSAHTLAHALERAPQVPQAGHIQEERTVQHLIAAFGGEMSECAFYEALATIAAAAADADTESLAREIQAEENEAGKKFFSLIRSRSKIAYNMLTPNELDPAVETKAFDNRVV
jgi:ferritin-like metal-binding protein YciE